MAIALTDVLLTVLYARAGSSILTGYFCNWAWRLLRSFSRLFGSRAPLVLSLGGPLLVISILFLWVALLTVGGALIFHPYLGGGIRTDNGPTPSGFVAALFAAGISMSIVGSSGFSPATSAFRLLFLFNSLIGTSVVSLTLTYLMQLYSALQRRNALGIRMYLLSGMTANSAEMLVKMSPQGHVEQAENTLSDLAASVAEMKETHQFYPVLLYFRFPEAHYSLSYITGTALDIVSLIETGLDSDRSAPLRSSGSVVTLWEASLLLLHMVGHTSHPADSYAKKARPTQSDCEEWERQFRAGVDRMRSAGIPVVSDIEAAARRYVEMRSIWAPAVQGLAHAMAYELVDVDPGRHREEHPRARIPYPAGLRT